MNKHDPSLTFPIGAVRSRFPTLSGAGDLPVYLDNPAGTLVPQQVIDAVADAMARASSNLGGFFEGSRRAEAIWLEAHRAAAALLGAASEREIVIAQNMTTLTLHLSRSIGRNFRPGDEIIVTRMDHEGNVSPWLLLARDLGPRGITVNLVHPGSTDTDMNPADGPRAAAQLARMAIPAYGKPQDIAAAVAYLASEEGRFITGAGLAVDGCVNT